MQAVEVMFGYQITLTEELASRFDYFWSENQRCFLETRVEGNSWDKRVIVFAPAVQFLRLVSPVF